MVGQQNHPSMQTLLALVVSAAVSAGSALLTVESAGMAQAGPATSLPDACMQYSSDHGQTWSDDVDDVNRYEFSPAAGGEYQHIDFHVRNVCPEPAVFQVFAGEWALPDGVGSMTLRAELGSDDGEKVPFEPHDPADAGVTINEHRLDGPGRSGDADGTVRSGRDVPVPLEVTLFVGVSSDEQEQTFNLRPGWAWLLREDGDHAGARHAAGDDSSGSIPLGSEASSILRMLLGSWPLSENPGPWNRAALTGGVSPDAGAMTTATDRAGARN